MVQEQLVSSWSNFVKVQILKIFHKLKIFLNLKIFLKVGDPTPPGVSDYSWTPVEGRIEDGSNRWYFNISGVGSAMDSSQEIFDRFQIWDQVLAEDLDIF